MRTELTFHETVQARAAFSHHAEDRATTTYQLRTMLSDLGQHPSHPELDAVLDTFGGKVTFEHFCRYLTFLKARFLQPEDGDADTVRAFVALGGRADRGGSIPAASLREAIKKFQLTIEVDEMLRDAEESDGEVSYAIFRTLWESAPNRPSSASLSDSLQPPSPKGPAPVLQMAGMPPRESVVNLEENYARLRAWLTVNRTAPQPAPSKKKRMMSRVERGTLKLPSLTSNALRDHHASVDAGRGDSAGDALVEEDEEVAEEERKLPMPPVPPSIWQVDPSYRRYMLSKPFTLGAYKQGVTPLIEDAKVAMAERARERPPQQTFTPRSARQARDRDERFNTMPTARLAALGSGALTARPPATLPSGRMKLQRQSTFGQVYGATR